MRVLKKIIKIILIVVVVIPILAVIFNYFLAHRLESYLKKELVSRVSDATDQFYRLSYDNLSINLLTGELRIEGIEFKPDSAIFYQWKAQDSLPDVYFDVKIDVIDFKGINLIWRWSYKKLNFDIFEIQSPVLDVYRSYHSSRTEQKTTEKKTEVKTLHELIEPYINVLTVGTLNLEHAFVSYHVDNLESPLVYKLEDVSFHAYGFRLDSLSARSGKLLYSDNFDFVTNRHQTLLSNNEFALQTDSIRLSTQDSIIYLEKIHLVPQEELWDEMKKKPSNYVDGQINKIQVDGIFFTRENALNYLKATTFGIYSPDIKVYNLDSRKKDRVKEPSMNADSLVQALSLYDLISPILQSVSIDQVSLENTTADYYNAFNGSIETYHLKDFTFYAYDFLVDSLSDAENIFWYSKNFVFEAKGLEGVLNARNHKISIDQVSLDTEKRLFDIRNARLRPISTRTSNDYLEGSIRSVNIAGLNYDNGISAELFEIESPDIKFVQASSATGEGPQSVGGTKKQTDIELMLNPLLHYLFIHNIRINSANFLFSDRNEKDTMTYRINGFNFYATDFLINEKTIGRDDDLFFNYKSFGFNFRKFDNHILNREYRLLVDNAVFSTVSGLRLENIELVPLKKTEPFFSLKAPLIELMSPSWALSMDHLLLKMQSVSLERFRMMNAEVGFNYKNMSLNPIVDLELKGLHYDNEKKNFDVKDVYFHTKNMNWTLDNGFYNLHAGDILFAENELKLDDIRLESPYSKEEFAIRHPKHTDRLGLNVNHFSLRNIHLPSLINERTLIAEHVRIDDVLFEIYKNKQIPVPLKYKPMIYEFIQKAPLRIRVDSVTVRNMDLIYEELSLKGKRPGKLLFTDINGVFQDVTNIVKHPDQYIILNADAKFMDDGYLTANWKIPVDSLNKSFLLDAHMTKFDFTTLNAMITPAAPIHIASGHANDLTFSIKGTDLLADIRMRLLYEDLIVDLLKEKDGEMVKRKFNSALVNMIVRNSNPRHKNGTPHITNITSVERDVNRSTFNYIWLLLRPAMADAVGVSQTGQEVVGEVVEFVKAIKSLFHPNKKDEMLDNKE